MREKDDLIKLLYIIYHSHEWQEMEEYFEVAYSLLMFHGAKFKLIDDLKDDHQEGMAQEFMGKHVFINIYGAVKRKQLKERFYLLYDNDPEALRLSKYTDCEEGWREEINAAQKGIEIFDSICHKFITFK